MFLFDIFFSNKVFVDAVGYVIIISAIGEADHKVDFMSTFNMMKELFGKKKKSPNQSGDGRG